MVSGIGQSWLWCTVCGIWHKTEFVMVYCEIIRHRAELVIVYRIW